MNSETEPRVCHRCGAVAVRLGVQGPLGGTNRHEWSPKTGSDGRIKTDQLVDALEGHFDTA